MQNIETAEKINEIISSEGIVVVLLSGLECNVCLSIMPDLEEMGKRHPRVRMINADPSAVKELVGAFMVLVYPTLLVFVDGKETYRFERLFSLDDMEQKLSRMESLYFD